MRIQELATHERPRERLRLHGIASLSDAELLAVLLGSGTRDNNAIELGRSLAKKGLRRLARMEVAELTTEPGIGAAKASRILASVELARRVTGESRGARITGSASAIRYCSQRIGHLPQEHVLVVWLDKRHQVLGDDIVTRGLVDESLLHARECFRGAIAANASVILIAHNHPSGDTAPSETDRQAARVLSAAGEIIGIPVLDHLVVTSRGGRSVVPA